MPGALTGYTVIDLTTGHAGALTTLFLSDHGARVVRVIDASAPAWREGGFVIWDRAKECCRIDLQQVRTNAPNNASRAFDALLAGADLVVNDYAPNDQRQSLIEPGALRSINAHIHTCAITAYGKTGPWRDEAAVDDLVLARMGVLAGMPGFRPPPVHVVHPLPSVGAATLATLGIAAALFAREDDGVGRDIETSLMAGALLYHPKVTSENLEQRGFQTHPSGSAPFYSVYRCADDRWVQLGCVHTGFIATAAEVLGIDRVLADPRFAAGRPEEDSAEELQLRDILSEVLAKQPFAHWAEAFEAADVPFAESRWTEDSLADAQVLHNRMLVELDDPELGSVQQMGVALTLTATPGAVHGPQHAHTLNAVPKDWPQARAFPNANKSATTPLSPPLQNTRILEITNLIAGPTAGRLLAELGADVVKFEPLTGDMSRPIGRAYFYSVNFNKRSVSVDTRTPDGKRIVQQIAQHADALVANLRPQATARMGIDANLNAQLLETHLTGYGWSGPYSKRPGIDPLAQAMMGLQRAQGGPHNAPVFPAQLAPTDFTTGAVGALGTVLCLLERKRHGVVQRAESNLLNGGILLTSEWFSRHAAYAARPLADRDQYGLSPYHRLYRTTDDWIYVAADTPAEREALRRLTKCQTQADDEQDGTNGVHPNETPYAEAMAAAFARTNAATWLAQLRAAKIPAAPVEGADGAVFLNSEHAQQSATMVEREHPTAGRIRVAWQYIQFGNTAETRGRPTPLLGEHTREVLAEVGFSDIEITGFYAAGVAKTAVDGF